MSETAPIMRSTTDGSKRTSWIARADVRVPPDTSAPRHSAPPNILGSVSRIRRSRRHPSGGAVSPISRSRYVTRQAEPNRLVGGPPGTRTPNLRISRVRCESPAQSVASTLSQTFASHLYPSFSSVSITSRDETRMTTTSRLAQECARGVAFGPEGLVAIWVTLTTARSSTMVPTARPASGSSADHPRGRGVGPRPRAAIGERSPPGAARSTRPPG